jgi:hypothetical protein
MMVSQMMPELILRECPDRRREERFIHRQPAEVDGRPVAVRDISAAGIAVVMRTPVSVGDLVHVNTNTSGRGLGAATPARVARVEPGADRIVVGLQFIQQ